MRETDPEVSVGSGGHCDSPTSCFSSPNLQPRKIHNCFFWARIDVSIRCLLTYIPDSIDEIKHLSIILIQTRSIIFGISPLNIQLLKGKAILATKGRWIRLIGTLHICLVSSSVSVMKIKIMSPQNHLQIFCEIFMNRSRRLKWPISRSLAHDIHSNFIYCA
jgi:hypothetical protein